VSRDGSVVFVASTFDNPTNAKERSEFGAVWPFFRAGSAWVQGTKFTVGGSTVNLGWTLSTSCDGSLVITSGFRDNTAHVFTRNGAAYGRTATISLPSDPVDVALSCDGLTAVVGTSTQVFVLSRNGATWTRQATLPIDPNEFVRSVALSGDASTALVGTYPPVNVRPIPDGVAYFFARSGSGWSRSARVTSPRPEPMHFGDLESADTGFGSSVVLSNDGATALIGAPSDAPADPPGTKKLHYVHGTTWVFVRSASGWRPQGDKLALSADAALGAVRGNFSDSTSSGVGLGLSADGNTALVGAVARYGFVNISSTLAVFVRVGETWTQQREPTIEHPLGSRTPVVEIAWPREHALSADGKVAVIGYSNGRAGAGEAQIFEFDPNAPTPPPNSAACIVPDVKSKTLAAAKKALVAGGCKLGNVRRSYSRTIKAGRVISQTYKPGTTLPPGVSVPLVVSRGRP
jgi:hypothetical protein